MSYIGIRSFNLGDMNGSQKSKNILEVYAEVYVNALMYVVFLEKDSTAFTRISEGSISQKR